MTGPFHIGTRGSALALVQADEVKKALHAPTEIVVIKTEGDIDLTSQLGATKPGFFSSVIQQRLLAGGIDMAAHSLKDLPTDPVAGLRVAAVLPRASASDLLLVRQKWVDETALFPVREGCVTGTSATRRMALAKHFAPHAVTASIRGNVPTRIRKMTDGDYGAIVIARAGVDRLHLDLSGLAAYELDPLLWTPAPGQGAVAVEIRSRDDALAELLDHIDCADTHTAVNIERSLLAGFEGGCRMAFGAYAEHSGGGTWRVHIGLERNDEWQWGMREGDAEQLMALRPADVTFGPLTGDATGILCRRL
ncbi:MAG: hydroxymethylbilane synthase [Pseudomonadota bacterium]|nr:hydroxymethylbilane synthase [Pseudomonadota bacterium]